MSFINIIVYKEKQIKELDITVYNIILRIMRVGS